MIEARAASPGFFRPPYLWRVNRPTATRRLFATVITVLVVGFAAFLWFRPLLNIANGYAAKHACSCYHLQGRELDDISKQDLNFSVLPYVHLGLVKGGVRATLLGLVPREAYYVPGRGCTLINDERAELVGADAGGRVGGKWEADPTLLPPPPLEPELIEALEYGMRPTAGGGARAIVVYKDGKLLADTYAPGFDPATRFLGWSMTKTLTALAWGRHLSPPVRAGLAPALLLAPARPLAPALLLDPAHPLDPARQITPANLHPTWTDARARITLAELLHMNSGLAWNEGYGSLTDATIMLHEKPDFAAYAARMPAVARPDSVWNYSSGTTNLLMHLLQEQIGAEHFHTFLYDSLFTRIAPSLLIEPDQSGTPVGSSYGWATARDWANLGQFMLQGGIWEGDTLIAPEWIEWMQEPATGSNGTYGGHLWLPGPDLPNIPEDAYIMRGFQDQRVFVVPSRNLVVARLGHGEDKSADFDGFLERLLTALD